MNVELKDAIYHRRSIRKYKPQQVSKDDIRTLMDAAVQAPSASNSQPWAFAVIQDQGILNNYSDQAKKLLLEQIDSYPPLAKYRTALSNPGFDIFYGAPTLLIIYAKPVGPHPEGDCCLAAQNIMLAAHSMGLGTCWIGFAHPLLNSDEIKQALGAPTDYTAVAPLIIGYPDGNMPAIRKKEPEIICWQPS